MNDIFFLKLSNRDTYAIIDVEDAAIKSNQLIKKYFPITGVVNVIT